MAMHASHNGVKQQHTGRGSRRSEKNAQTPVPVDEDGGAKSNNDGQDGGKGALAHPPPRNDTADSMDLTAMAMSAVPGGTKLGKTRRGARRSVKNAQTSASADAGARADGNGALAHPPPRNDTADSMDLTAMAMSAVPGGTKLGKTRRGARRSVKNAQTPASADAGAQGDRNSAQAHPPPRNDTADSMDLTAMAMSAVPGGTKLGKTRRVKNAQTPASADADGGAKNENDTQDDDDEDEDDEDFQPLERSNTANSMDLMAMAKSAASSGKSRRGGRRGTSIADAGIPTDIGGGSPNPATEGSKSE